MTDVKLVGTTGYKVVPNGRVNHIVDHNVFVRL